MENFNISIEMIEAEIIFIYNYSYGVKALKTLVLSLLSYYSVVYSCLFVCFPGCFSRSYFDRILLSVKNIYKWKLIHLLILEYCSVLFACIRKQSLIILIQFVWHVGPTLQISQCWVLNLSVVTWLFLFPQDASQFTTL